MTLLYRKEYSGDGIKRVNMHCHVSIVSVPFIECSCNSLEWYQWKGERDKDKSKKPLWVERIKAEETEHNHPFLNRTARREISKRESMLVFVDSAHKIKQTTTTTTTEEYYSKCRKKKRITIVCKKKKSFRNHLFMNFLLIDRYPLTSKPTF